MISTLNAAPTDRWLRGFATRRPEWFAVLTCAAYSLPLFALALLGRQEQFATTTANPAVLLGQITWMILLPAALLTALGWWGTAGFTRRSTWRSLVPFLPLTLFVLAGVLSLVLSLGTATHKPGLMTLGAGAVTVLAIGFGEEATFRGVVLQTLLPRGLTRAVVISSVLFGATSIGALALEMDPVAVAVQVLITVGIGVGFAAVVVVTGTIWPLVVIHAAMELPILAGFFCHKGGIVGILIDLVLGGLAAAYGIWLLHRHQHADRPSHHHGETF